MLLLYLIVLYVYLLWQIFDVQRGRRRRTKRKLRKSEKKRKTIRKNHNKVDLPFCIRCSLLIEDLGHCCNAVHFNLLVFNIVATSDAFNLLYNIMIYFICLKRMKMKLCCIIHELYCTHVYNASFL